MVAKVPPMGQSEWPLTIGTARLRLKFFSRSPSNQGEETQVADRIMGTPPDIARRLGGA